MNADERRYDSVTEQIIGAAFAVSNEHGIGFLEKVYESSLFVELTMRSLKVESQKRITIRYRGVVVGEYVADLLVEGAILVEVKHASGINDAHVAQCLNYLKATGLKLCILLNFGTTKVEVRRIVRTL